MWQRSKRLVLGAIWTLILAVTAAALGFLAATSGSPAATRAVAAVLVLALMVSAVAACSDSPLRRPAQGFFVFAGMHAAIVFTDVAPELRSALPTRWGSAQLADWLGEIAGETPENELETELAGLIYLDVRGSFVSTGSPPMQPHTPRTRTLLATATFLLGLAGIWLAVPWRAATSSGAVKRDHAGEQDGPSESDSSSMETA